MSLFVNVRSFLRNLFLSRRVDGDLDQELQSHLEMLIEENIREGMSPQEAQRAARIELGGAEQVKEQVREQRIGNWLQSVLSDCRYGLRQLRKNPGFTAIAVLTLALGIGANTAIFSVVDAMLLRPMPYPAPDRLVRIWESSLKYNSSRNVVNPLNFLDWCDQSQSFESMAAISGLMTNLNSHGQPIAVQGMQVSPDFFSILRIAPFLGRTFIAADGVSGQDRQVILSYELWQRQFGADRSVVGQKIDVDGQPSQVIGVMPKGFSFPKMKAEVWTPLPLARTEEFKEGRFLTVVARLKPGISIAQAQQEMLRVADFTAQARPDYNKNWSVNVVPMLEDATQGVRRPLLVLLASVGFLLLIACANVANLLLMRGTGRLRELAVRSALGAARSRIIRQLLAESLLLSLAGMAVGILFAYLSLPALLALIPQSAPLPRSEPISIDARVFLFAFLASLFTVVVFGLVPALRLSTVDLQNALKQGSLRGGVGGHQTLRRSFVVAEVALALLLCIGAGLMLRSLARLTSVDPGFRTEHLLTMHIWMSPSHYSDNLKRSQYVNQLLSEIRNTPGVEAAGSTHFLPLMDQVSGSCFAPADQPVPTPAESPSAQFLIISSGYFQTMGTALLSGRDFADRDNFNSLPVAVVNHAFAERYFPAQQILGKQLHVCWTIEKPVEIVGVVADARQAQLQDAPEPTIFLSHSQAPMYFATIVVRAAAPRQVAHAAEAAIHRVDPDQAVSNVQTMESVLSDSVASPRFQAVLLFVFAGLAVVLAMIGVYGVVSYSVSNRSNEIGIRLALGADTADIARSVLGEALALTGIALVLGLLGSLALSRLLQTLLFDVKPTDPATLIIVCFVVFAVSALAAALPARRATRVDPVITLRYE
ncbi:MAG TPA: ABC transporter permease [Candidatus Acidoferrum sp.]|jgi:putative ABC transport system permease protein